MALANALIGQESGGRSGAVSPAGATGLTQVMPGTAAGMYGITEAQARKKLKNPEFALDAGFRYLAHQKKSFGTWRLALAAYNAGPNAVKEYGGVPPYSETQNYVRNILAKAGVLRGQAASQTAAVDKAAPVVPSSAVGGSPVPSGPDLGGLAVSNLAKLRQGRYNPQEALGELAMAVAATPKVDVPAPGTPPKATPASGTSFSLPEDGKWRKWVRVPEASGSTSEPHKEVVLRAVAALGRRAGAPLTVWDNTTHSRTTVDGNTSDHGDGMAADIPATGAKLRRLGYLALKMAGMNEKDARKARKTGGLFNVNGYQIIFATQQGGDHDDHVHIAPPRR